MSRLLLGIQSVREAIRTGGDRALRVVVGDPPNERTDAVARFARDRGVPVERRPMAELDRIARGGRHQGVIAWAPELVIRDLDALVEDGARPGALTVLLDGVTDPQNFGAVIRSAVALGATGVAWAEHGAAPLSPATFRASAGAIEHARLYRTRGTLDAVRALGDVGVTTIALDASGPAELAALDLAGPIALVVGAEDRGPRPAVRKACSHLARLPMRGPLDSLNASVAGALAVYEVIRKRESSFKSNG
jgi:23S rRNA (guanosine2251-2'-O)-methyltransferase